MSVEQCKDGDWDRVRRAVLAFSGCGDTHCICVFRTTANQKGTRMNDPTEPIRREMVAQINGVAGSREYLESKHGQVWDTSQLQEDFEVLGFLAPFVIARRKSDGVRGSLLFQNSPRIYFGFQPE
jgi:hypothetical protein